MPSRFSVKMRTRRSFHFGGAPLGALAERRQVRAQVLADPVDQRADLGVGQVPRAARRSPASGRGAPARGARALPPSASRGGSASAAAVTASICAASSASSSSASSSARSSSASGAVVKQLLGSRLASARAGCRRLRLVPLPLDGRAVDVEAAGERLDRGEQPLLQADDEQARRRPACGATSPAKRSSRAVRYSSRRRESTSSGASAGRPSMAIADDVALREAALDRADVLLEPADHHVLERLLAADRDAAGEAVRVEELEQRREAVRVAVVRRGREEQPVLEAAGEVADGAGELRLDAVAAAARRRGVVRLVEDQQAAGQQSARASRAAGRRRSGRSAGGARPGSGCACATGSRRSRARGGPRRGSARSRISKTRPKRSSSSSCHCSSTDGGQRRRSSSPSCAGAARGRSGRPRSSCRGRCRRR